MKRRTAVAVAGILLFAIGFAFLGSYGIHVEECIKCGAMRTQWRVGHVPLWSTSRETELSEWYRSFDPSHTDHSWGALCGTEHTWSDGWPRGWSHYDNFGWTTAFALRDLYEHKSEMPADELAEIMNNYVEADVTSIAEGTWRLPEESLPQAPDGCAEDATVHAPKACADLQSLSGIVKAGVKSEFRYFLELDGMTGRMDLSGEPVAKFKPGDRVMVKGRIKTKLWNPDSDGTPQQQPVHWVIYMEVYDAKEIASPFGLKE